jgi:hypothetical protein
MKVLCTHQPDGTRMFTRGKAYAVTPNAMGNLASVTDNFGFLRYLLIESGRAKFIVRNDLSANGFGSFPEFARFEVQPEGDTT